MFYKIFGVALIAGIMLCNCHGQDNNIFEEQTLKDTVNQRIYTQYLLQFKDSIRSFIQNKASPYYSEANKNEMPFFSKIYDGKTEIFIDTILFSPTQSKIAFFIITKNSNDKLLSKDDTPAGYFFGAYCFIAKLSNSNIWNIKWLDPSSNDNYHSSYKQISSRIRETYFKEFINVRDSVGNSFYKYNLNDIRFWNGPVWNMYF